MLEESTSLLRLSTAFVVCVGAHGDRGAHAADVILPGAAYTEKTGIYVNTEGGVQFAERAVLPKGAAKEDWAIFRALSERPGIVLPYDSIYELRTRLMHDHPSFGRVDYVAGGASAKGFDPSRLGEKGLAVRRPVHGRGRRPLPDQSDRARERRHGRMFGCARAPSRPGRRVS